jgi:hypothetical protein
MFSTKGHLRIESNAKQENPPAILGTKECIDRIRNKFYKQQYDRNIPKSRILAPTGKEMSPIVLGEYNKDGPVFY